MREIYSFETLDRILGEMNFRHSSTYDTDVNKGDTVDIARFDTEKADVTVERVKVLGGHDDPGKVRTLDGKVIDVHKLPIPGMCGFKVVKSPYWKNAGKTLADVGWKPHMFPPIDPSYVEKGDFVITRFLDGHPKNYILVQKVKEVYADGFEYDSVFGNAGFIGNTHIDEAKQSIGDFEILLARLPHRFTPPLDHKRVYEVGAIHIPKGQGKELRTFSKDKNFQLSLACLDLPYENHPSIERTIERFALR